MPDDGRGPGRAGQDGDRQAPEVQAPGPLLGGPGEAGQLRPPNRSGPIGVVAVALLALGACGATFDRPAAIESFQRANPDATGTQSACVVDRLIERYGLEQLEGQLANDPLLVSFEQAQFRDMIRCGIVGDVADQLEAELELIGVDPDQIPCVTDSLIGSLDDDGIDVLLSGEITDDFALTFNQAMDDCDALNP